MRNRKVSSVDTVIIGAGIAGLLTALRLSLQGQKVLVIEKNKIGSGSTISNHGMVHSGALYVRQHSHVVEHCKEAKEVFYTLLKDAYIPQKESVYVLYKNKLEDFVNKLNIHNYAFHELSSKDVPEVKKSIGKDYRMIAIQENVYSSKKLLKLLTSYCIAQNVTFFMGTAIKEIVIKNEKATGVMLGSNEFIKAKNIVVASGIGTTEILKSFKSYYCRFLKSRLDMMAHLPLSNISRGILFTDLDKPIIMPNQLKSALGSFFGSIQPIILGDRKFSVDFEKAKSLIETIQTYFNVDVVSTDKSQMYMCGKIDYTGEKTTEKGFINPDYHVIDHRIYDGISGIFTIVTGKMTLAFHASKKATDLILDTHTDLLIPPQKGEKTDDKLFTVEPWSSLSQA